MWPHPMPSSLIAKSLEEVTASWVDSLLQVGSHNIYTAVCDGIS